MEQEVETIKPFADPNYTMIHNDAIDHIMPRLTAGAWMVLTVIIRATWGWKDEATVSGRKERDRLTYDQFQERTGLCRTAITKALRELRGIKKHKDGTIEQVGPAHIHREEAPRRRGGPEKPSYFYSLNTKLEIEVPVSSLDVRLESSLDVRLETPPFPVQRVDYSKETLEIRSKKESGAKRRPPDPRLKHPACKIYRKILKKTLPKAVRDDVMACADEIGLDRWEATCEFWKRRDHNPLNVDGLIDRARNGLPVADYQHQARKGDRTDAELQQYVEAGIIKA